MNIAIADMAIALLAGGLTTLSPCVLPILPLVVGSAAQQNRGAPVAMAAGMVLSFVLLGVLIGLLGSALGVNSDNVRIVGAWLLIIMALAMLLPTIGQRVGGWLTPVAAMADRAAGRFSGQTLGGAFALGGVLGLVWSPCSGPLLGSAVALVAREGGALHGGLILGLFGLGAALPLMGVAYATRAGFRRFRDAALAQSLALKRGFGVLLLLLGIAMLNGWDKALETVVLNQLPDGWVNLTVMF